MKEKKAFNIIFMIIIILALSSISIEYIYLNSYSKTVYTEKSIINEMELLKISMETYIKNFFIKNPTSKIDYLTFDEVNRFKVDFFIFHQNNNSIIVDLIIKSNIQDYQNIRVHKRLFIYVI
jgi:hypothetical protein